MKSSDCRTINQEAITQHREKYSCGAHFHTILWRAKVCVFSQRNENNSQKNRPIWKVSSNLWTIDVHLPAMFPTFFPIIVWCLKVWLLTFALSHLNPWNGWSSLQKTEENLEMFKLSPWPQETDSQNIKKDWVYKESDSGKIWLLYFAPRNDSDHFATQSYVFFHSALFVGLPWERTISLAIRPDKIPE